MGARWPWLVALSVVCLLVAGPRPVAVADGEPMVGPIVERTRWVDRGEYQVRVTATFDASRGDPDAAMDALVPGTHTPEGDVSAQFILWGKWAATRLPLVFAYNPAGAPPGFAEFELPLQRSMDVWMATPGQSFTFALAPARTARTPASCGDSGEPDAVNVIGWLPLPGPTLGVTCTFFLPGRGGTREAFETDMAFASQDVAWSLAWNDQPAGTYDLWTTVLHEFGHALGLDHSGDLSSVMSPRLSRQEQRRLLTPDDVDGIRALYGDGKPLVAPQPRPPLPRKVFAGFVVR